jgi:hypothetical protein
MMDEHDQPVLVDFAACRPIGEESFTLGLEWWNEGYTSYKSSLENDAIGLEKTRKSLKLPQTKANCSSSVMCDS